MLKVKCVQLRQQTATCSSALVAPVQARMPLSVGVCLPFSILDISEPTHGNDSARCLSERPACWRRSRSRLPSTLRASSTLEVSLLTLGDKLISDDGMMTGRITLVIVFHDDRRVLDDFRRTKRSSSPKCIMTSLCESNNH